MNSRRPRSISDYSRAARRHKLAIAAPALVPLAIATGVALEKLPKLYESSARMLITQAKKSLSEQLNFSYHGRQKIQMIVRGA